MALARAPPRCRILLFLFDNFILDVDQRELRRDGAAVPIQPQVFDLLEYLIRHRDRVVSKDDLIAAIWSGRIVSESALTTRINAARTAIGDSGEAQQLIRTLPRKGIRFVGTVLERDDTEVEDSSERGQSVERSQRDAARASIAVLPLVNVSGEIESLHFGDGLAEDVITELSRSPELFVVSRNSSFIYREKSVDTRKIGQALGVKFVLEGSVRRAATGSGWSPSLSTRTMQATSGPKGSISRSVRRRRSRMNSPERSSWLFDRGLRRRRRGSWLESSADS
jgi:DNA-binding winged helix-turn-helix (wHTH) protein